MLEPSIADFFSERKKNWLKDKLKSNTTEFEKASLIQQCEEEFSLETWLPIAAKCAGQMSFSTHPCTFSHPSSRKNKNGYVTSIIADAARQADGYLRSGNVDSQTDALGNAAVLPIYKFLSIVTADGRTVIEHIQNDTELAQALLNIKTESYENLRVGFMAMIKSDKTMITSSKIKQVYFPVDNDYHLLSIVSNSGLIFELRNRIDALRFSEKVQLGREKKRNNNYYEPGYSELYNITTIGYGGTKPQNISVLNNQYNGKAHLLLSVPPILEQREISFPSRDFFKQTLHYYDCKEILLRLDNILKTEREGTIPLDKIRKGRDRCLGDILDVVLQKMMMLRQLSMKQKQLKNEPSNSFIWQKIWLCEQYKEERLQQDNWLDTLCEHIARWICDVYKKNIHHPILLGNAERLYISEFINANREALR